MTYPPTKCWPKCSKKLRHLLNCVFKAAVIVLVVGSFFAGGATAGDKPFLLKTKNGQRLQAIATNEGVAKVIIRFDVPEIDRLTAASNRYKHKTTKESLRQDAFKAKRELAHEIASVSDKIISRLQLHNVVFNINQDYETLPLIAMDVSENALMLLDTAEEVLSINEDRLIPPVLDNTTRIIGAQSVWNDGYTGTGWYVAILDTGIRSSHDFFAGKSIVEACYSGNWECPNNQNEMLGPGSAVHHPSIYEGFDHGTHVTGIAVGNDPNSQLFGVARGADIIAIQVFSRFSGESYCGVGVSNCVLSYVSDQIKGLERVYALRTVYDIASVNLSLGGGKYANQSACNADYGEMKLAIDNLRNVGIATLIAAGNDGYCDGISAPACISSAIAVGATNDYDNETSFSNWHESLLDLFAPGAAIIASTGTSDTSYASWSGTSMATPHVAGSWALLRQKYPTLSVSSLLSALSNTGAEVNTKCPGSDSKPRVMVNAAFDYIDYFDEPPATPGNLQATAVSYNQINLSWKDNSDFETSFTIERRIGAQGSYRPLTTVDVNVTTYKDKALKKATTYYYRISAHNFYGDSGYSNEAHATTPSWNQQIVWRYPDTGLVYAWLMDGTSIESAAAVATVADLKWQIAGLGDLNADGNADLLWWHPDTGSVYAWLMNGTTIKAAAPLATVADLKWQIAGLGDLDADGNADLLWWHPGTGSVYAWLMDGTTIKAAAPLATVADLKWQIAGLGDLDADGNADLLWWHPGTGSVYAWLMDGTTIKAAAPLATVADLKWQIAGLGDLDADGNADLLWWHPGTGSVYAWLMDGTTIKAAAPLATVADLKWQIAGLGDLDADGNADLLWWHPGTGSVYAWLMDGTTIKAAAPLATVADLKWQIAGISNVDADSGEN
jgi:subtilisin family serine protease